MVYFCIKSAYLPGSQGNPGNNGRITFPYSVLKKGSGFSSDTTISRAIQELEEKGWIKVSKHGGLFKGVSMYELTGKYDPCL
jgi:predicted transcriptional regulator